MKTIFRRTLLWPWVAGAILLALLMAVWLWPKIAEHYTSIQLRSTLSQTANSLTPALSAIGFTVESPRASMCIHPTGRSIWLATIECQDFAIVKPKQSLAKTQASYTAGAIQFTTHLKDQGWTISDASLDPNAFGPSGIIFTKTIGANACWLRVSFGIAPGAFECDRNVKVPVLPLPYYYEYYGGG
jgi:hypothetical protein